MIQTRRILRWLYVARLTLAAGIFAGVLLVWTQPDIAPETTLLITLALVLSAVVTAASFWYTHIAEGTPGETFLYGQALFDTALVTTVVHVTGGGGSDFASLYILVIAEGALLLPFRGGMLVGALATLVYFGDSVWGHGTEPSASVFLQMGLFALTALATGWLGDRLRRTGTELGAVESELRQLRLDTTDILGAIDTGVVTVDEAGHLVYINGAAESLLGMRRRDWLGRQSLAELDRVAPGLGDTIRRTATARVPVRWYETHTKSPGSVRVLGVRTTALEREDHPWVTAVLQDITDGKRVEDLHRRAERLEAVAELAASLAHEIKNPLASIRSAIEQFGNGRLAQSDQATLQRLVVSESDRLSRLLSEFIEFSRVQVRKREVVDLGRLAEHAIDLVRQHPDGSDGTEISFTVPEAEVRMEGDGDLLHRALFNLVLNAVQHAGEGGRVRVDVGQVSELNLPGGVSYRDPIRVTVADSGPGIPAEDVSRIFDPFFTSRRGGTGLGLALVHRAVEAHSGAIFVETAAEGGAEFTVYLPAKATASDEAARPSKSETRDQRLATKDDK